MEVLYDPEKSQAAESVINWALDEIQRKYGTGTGDGEQPKAYHNLIHAQEVRANALLIANLAVLNGQIGPDDVALIEIAASCHDLVQDLPDGQDELQSAKATVESMAQTGVFTAADQDKVWRMIYATTIKIDERGLMRQLASKNDYLTQILADADLAITGAQTQLYWSRTRAIIAEIFGPNPPQEALAEFAKTWAGFLGSSAFYTAEARILFPNRTTNIALLQEFAVAV